MKPLRRIGILLSGTIAASMLAGCGPKISNSIADGAEADAQARIAVPTGGDAGGSGSTTSPARAVGPPPPVAPAGNWAPAVREDIVLWYPAIGIFRPRQSTQLGSQVSGRVKDVLVDVGDEVQKDQPLILVDPAFFEIELEQRKAEVDAAKVALDDADLNLKRMRNLWEKPEGKEPSIPQKLFDDAKNRFDAATVRVRQASEAVRHAEERLKECSILAPYDGVVTGRLVDPGEPVTTAPVTHLLEIQEIAVLELEFSLPQAMLTRVARGTRVLFQVEGIAGIEGQGEVETVYPAVDEATRTFRCRLLVENAERKFRPGLLVQVQVADREARAALSVPAAAVTEAAAGSTVQVRAEPAPERRRVKLGLRGKDRVEVLDGLREGEEVFLPAS